MRSRSCWLTAGSLCLVVACSPKPEKPSKLESVSFVADRKAILDGKGEPVPAFRLVRKDVGSVAIDTESKKEPPPPPEPETVSVTIVCNTKAEILDAGDDAVLGSSGDSIEFKLSNDPIVLLLRAEGFEEKRVKVVPSKNTDMTVDLAKTEPVVTEAPSPKKRPSPKKGAETKEKLDDVNRGLDEIVEGLKKKKKRRPRKKH